MKNNSSILILGKNENWHFQLINLSWLPDIQQLLQEFELNHIFYRGDDSS